MSFKYNPDHPHLIPAPHLGYDVWIHTLEPEKYLKQINNVKTPDIANNEQNKKLGVSGETKKERCSECTRLINMCKCNTKYALPSYHNEPNIKDLPFPTK